jgi:hypothetical protein
MSSYPPRPKRAPLEGMESWTLRVEDVTGEDSIATIIEHYSTQDDEGRRTDIYECVFPGCHWRTRDAEKMWRHVHESRKHR